MENEILQTSEGPVVSVGKDGTPKRGPRRLIILAVVILVIILAIIWLGDWVMKRELTEDQKLQILRSLELPPDSPILTEEEKIKILRSLEISSKDQMTDDQKQKILESLR